MNKLVNQLQNWINTNSAIILELGIGIIAILLASQFLIRSICNYIRDPQLRLQVRQGLRSLQFVIIFIYWFSF